MNRIILVALASVLLVNSQADEAQVDYIVLEDYASEISMKWGPCSTTVTQNGSYSVNHCLTEVEDDDQIIYIGFGNKDALPECVGDLVPQENLASFGWPGIFRNTLIRTDHKYIGFIDNHHVMSGSVFPGQSGGAVMSTDRQCVLGSLQSVMYFGNRLYSSFFKFDEPVPGKPFRDYPNHSDKFVSHADQNEHTDEKPL
jgi:hypothetical protein